MTDLILIKGKMPLIKKKDQTFNRLVFHIPEAVKNRLGDIPGVADEIVPEVHAEPRLHVRQVLTLVPEPELENESLTLELEVETPIVLVKQMTSVEIEEPEVEFEVAVESSPKATTELVIENTEKTFEIQTDEITPFLELKLENPEAVFNTGKSFLKDVAEGKRHFGFTAFSNSLNEAHLLVYASFLQFSLKKPVLVITKDINHSSFSRFKKHFTNGALLNWTTSEWGDVCIVDQKQLINQAETLSRAEFEFIKSQFSAVFWSLPKGNVQSDFQKSFMSILNILDSVTFVVSKGESKVKEIETSASYYQCFNVPVKGVLFEEKLKT